MIDERKMAHHVMASNGRDRAMAYTWIGRVFVESLENLSVTTTVAFSPQGAREMAVVLNDLADAAELEAALGLGGAA